MRLRVQLLLLFCAVACFAAGSGINESIFNNFLSDTFHLTADARGFLELPRETPGFLVVLMTGILCALPETRIGLVGGLMLALGFVGLGLFGSTSYSTMMAMMILASAGLHLLQPIGASVAISLSDERSRGKRLGQMGAVSTAGMLVGSACIALFLKADAPQYRAAFICAGAAAAVGAAIYGRMHIPHLQTPKPRLVVRRKYWLYYLLNFIFGARKQIFITFGPWVLIRVYGLPAKKIALLFAIASASGIVFKPLAGMLIDWAGERLVMIGDGLVLSVVCLGYGFAMHLTPDPRVALTLASICFVVDDLLFSLGTARAVYLARLAHSPQEITSTLAMGVSINHIASMTIPLAAGAAWMAFGYERVFLGAAVLAVGISLISCLVPPRERKQYEF